MHLQSIEATGYDKLNWVTSVFCICSTNTENSGESRKIIARQIANEGETKYDREPLLA